MRGQVSLEFIIVFSVAILSLASLFIVGADRIETAANDRHREEVNDIVLSVQQELTTALTVHDGYSRRFYLPYTISSTPYVFTMQNTSGVSVVTLHWKNTQQSVRTPICGGTLQPGWNTVRKENNSLWCNQ